MSNAAALGRGSGAAGNKRHLNESLSTANAAEPQQFPTGYGKSDTRHLATRWLLEGAL